MPDERDNGDAELSESDVDLARAHACPGVLETPGECISRLSDAFRQRRLDGEAAGVVSVINRIKRMKRAAEAQSADPLNRGSHSRNHLGGMVRAYDEITSALCEPEEPSDAG